MAGRTTISVDKDSRTRFGLFEDAAGTDSATEALEELLDIAAAEGYWNGDGEPMTVSKERLDELDHQQKQLAQAFTQLRDRVEEHHGES